MAGEELPSVDLQRTSNHVGMLSDPGRLEKLHALLVALAGAPDEDGIVRAVTKTLSTIIPLDLIGIARSDRDYASVWSQNQQREPEARLRRYLLRRVGHLPSDSIRPSRSLRLVHSRSMSLVPPSAALSVDVDGQPVNGYDIPLALGPSATGLVCAQKSGAETFTEWEEQALHIVATVLALSLRNADASRSTQDMVFRDSVTDTPNQQAFEGALMRELRAGLRYKVPSCLMVLGLDYFHVVNDRLGHVAGDHLLKAVADLIRNIVRDMDFVGRCEEDRFAVILPHTETRQARMLAERLRNRIEQYLFVDSLGQVRTTASVGIAAIPDVDVASTADWMAIAGYALKDAKAQGKNRVVLHTPKPPTVACAVALSLVA